MEQYSIDLPIFEGPFDLLLFFIKGDEIDIHDIPIAKITEDFLTYIEEAKRLDISLASDFIVMAASLIRIKSKTLLPRYNQEIEDGGEDPRQSLAHQLLVYQQYKEASEWLKELADTRALYASRGQNPEEGRQLAKALQREAIPLESPSLNALHRAYVRLLQQQKYRNAPKHEVKEAAFTLKEKKAMGKAMTIFVGIQYGLGVLTLVYAVGSIPLLYGSLHQLVAMGLVMCFLRLRYAVRLMHYTRL